MRLDKAVLRCATGLVPSRARASFPVNPSPSRVRNKCYQALAFGFPARLQAIIFHLKRRWKRERRQQIESAEGNDSPLYTHPGGEKLSLNSVCDLVYQIS